MKQKIVFKIFIVMVVLMLIILGYKIFILNNYMSQELLINTDKIFNEVITIKKEKEIVDSEILKFEKLSIKNYFKEYVESENNINFKVKYDDEGNVISFYSISKFDQYINLLNLNSFMLYNPADKKNYNFETEEDMRVYLKKRKIENDVDLLRYVKDNYYIKNNIFMSKKTMKNNFLINSLVEVAMPQFENIVLLNGRVTGYIINMNDSNIKEIHMLYGGEQYILVLSGEEITNNEFINDLLETVKFNI